MTAAPDRAAADPGGGGHGTRALRIATPVLAALVILLYALSTAYSLRLILRFQHEALYWDQWFTIPLFDRVIRGTATLQDFIVLHGEHRILLPRLVFVLDLWLTGARNGVNFAAIFLVQGLHVALFDRILAPRLPGLPRLALTAFVALMLFSAVQSENLEWGFQVQFVGVFLLFSLAACALATAQVRLQAHTSWHLAAIGLACGVGSALTMSNGAAALACIALVFGAARLLNRLTLATALLAAVVLVTYAASLTPAPEHMPLGSVAKHPLVFIDYVAVYLGSFFAPLGLTLAWMAGLAGLAAACLVGFALFARRLAADRVNLTLIAIMTFVVATAAMTAMGRASSRDRAGHGEPLRDRERPVLGRAGDARGSLPVADRRGCVFRSTGVPHASGPDPARRRDRGGAGVERRGPGEIPRHRALPVSPIRARHRRDAERRR